MEPEELGIADAAEVADRTFYRYFASKEAALLHPLSMFVDDFVAATRVHLERVDPLRSMLSAVDDLQAVGHYDDSMAFLVRSVASHPSIAGEYHNELLRGESALTVSFAEHLGVAPQAHTPRLLAAAGTMALTAAITTWQADPSVDVWELGRVGLRHAATGLDLLARAPGHGAPRS
jgi:AcrR family transcriptional regulator